MNFGMILLAFLLCAGAVFSIFMIASQNQTPIVDSFGHTQTNTTNETQSTVGNVTASFSGATGGLALVFGFFIVIVAVAFLLKAVGL